MTTIIRETSELSGDIDFRAVCGTNPGAEVVYKERCREDRIDSSFGRARERESDDERAADVPG